MRVNVVLVPLRETHGTGVGQIFSTIFQDDTGNQVILAFSNVFFRYKKSLGFKHLVRKAIYFLHPWMKIQTVQAYKVTRISFAVCETFQEV